ncbi:CLUMA_CG007636, isoform A [Clunio marinus]|uniref:CLUMA_CG007636, isoform A n=1 Tax=Clunio marinus TaxID=568069 RepID=A0A1J1I6R9_9DIPT|nr:CLUMA_CG007636, isoform A [Clunio marinus]
MKGRIQIKTPSDMVIIQMDIVIVQLQTSNERFQKHLKALDFSQHCIKQRWGFDPKCLPLGKSFKRQQTNECVSCGDVRHSLKFNHD